MYIVNMGKPEVRGSEWIQLTRSSEPTIRFLRSPKSYDSCHTFNDRIEDLGRMPNLRLVFLRPKGEPCQLSLWGFVVQTKWELCTWKVPSVDELANAIAIIAVGQALHIDEILRTAGSAPKATRKGAVKEAIKLLPLPEISLTGMAGCFKSCPGLQRRCAPRVRK
jgi:hypothetical protein